MKLLAIIHVVVLFPAVILFTNLLTGWAWWAMAIPYFYVAQFYFKGRFGLMLHCICHRKLFKKQYADMMTEINFRSMTKKRTKDPDDMSVHEGILLFEQLTMTDAMQH